MEIREADTSAGWETVRREMHFQNDHLAVETVEIRSPNRAQPRPWTIVHRKVAVVVAPLTREGKLVLIRQERIPIRAAIWEMPAGQVDDRAHENDHALAQIARNELQEEAGYEIGAGGELIALGKFFSSPGFTDEVAHLFLARPVQKSARGHAHEESESILDCREFTIAEIARMIAEGEINDANTLSVFARLHARGFLSRTLD